MNVEECLHASGLSSSYFSAEVVDVMVQAYSEVAVTATMDAAASGSSSFFSSVAAWALAVALAVADALTERGWSIPEEAIRRGILQKPQRHHLSEGASDTPRTMNQIGG